MIETACNSLLWSLFGMLASFVILALIFIPMERAFPARPGQAMFRAHWRTDVMFFIGQQLLWSSLIVSILHLLRPLLLSVMPPAWHAALDQVPWIIRAIFAVLLGDIAIYWVHRLQHSVPFLWQFHSVHHTAEHLDWLAAHREHPVDGFFTQLTLNMPILLLGFPTAGIAGFILFRGLWAIYLHSNIKLPLGPLKYVFGSPEIHHWHHEKGKVTANFANLCPLIDICFGTFKCPSQLPLHLGISGPHAQSYLKLLVNPLDEHPILKRVFSRRP